MARYALKLPDELKELAALCRTGNLFAVEEWIQAGKPYQPGPGRYATTPFKAAMTTGFQSLVEVFLRAGIADEEKERALQTALEGGRLDLIELLAKYGTDWRAVDQESVLCCRNPHVLRWFVDQGFDLSGWRIAYALIAAHREFLGIYMSVRDRIPCARKQANMALRHHAREGNLKWVSLLLWAGADPRAKAPSLDGIRVDEDDMRTPLEDAVVHSRLDILKKFRIDPERDNPTDLLAECWMCRDPGVVEVLLKAGADPNGRTERGAPMHSLMRNFEWSIDPTFQFRSGEVALRCIELAAERGGRWRPDRDNDAGGLRRVLQRVGPYEGVRHLHRLIDSGVFEGDVLRRFVGTPKMNELIASSRDTSLQRRIMAHPVGGAKSRAVGQRTRS